METAGTAMKTVIARFTELKKDPAEIGEVDGEVVDANKIETALRSVGVALRDTSGQFRDLDDVFLDLASKWDGLDTNTQRYIATIAAGSRQQSRFIAMMSNYNRTMELVSAANNSAGASQRQYEKTLDSLESKLAKLKNAWHSFILGITDSEIIKAGVDLLTLILTAINKITDALPGALNGFGKLFAAIMAFKLGKAVMDSLFASIGSAFVSAGAASSVKFWGSFKQNTAKQFKWIGNIISKSLAPSIATTKSSEAALNSYTLATNNLNSATALRKTLEDNNRLTEEKSATLDRIKARNTEAKAKAEAEYAAALGLSEGESKSALAVQALGIPQDRAIALAKSGVTEQMVLETQARAASLGVKVSELPIQELLNLGYTGEQIALLQSNKTRQSGLVIRAAELIATITQTGATKGNTIATWLQKVAQDALNGSLWATVGVLAMVAVGIGLIILAIWGLVEGIKALIKYIKNSTPEGKLKALEEQYSKLNEQAEALNDSIDDLKDKRDGLNELYNTFQNLTTGTSEWKEALIEINSRVLELLDTYPELAQYIEKGANGELKIAEEGFDVVLDKQMERVSNVQAAQSINKIQQIDTKTQVDLDKKLEETLDGYDWAMIGADAVAGATGGAMIGSLGGPIGTAIGATVGAIGGVTYGAWAHTLRTDEEKQQARTGGLTFEDYSRFAAEAADRGITITGNNKEEFEELYRDLFNTTEGFETVYSKAKELGGEFDKLAIEANKVKIQQEAYRESLITSAAVGSKKVSESGYYEQIVNLLDIGQDYNTTEDIRAKQASYEKEIKDTKGLNLKEEYANALGYYYDSVDKKIYTDISKETEITKTKEEMTAGLASARLNKEIQKEAENLVDVLDTVANNVGKDSEEFKKFSNLLSKEGKNLSSKELSNFAEFFGNKSFKDLTKDDINKYFATLGTSVEELGLSFDDLINNLSLSSQRLKDIYNNLPVEKETKESIQTSVKEIVDSLGSDYHLSLDNEEAFAKVFANISNRGGNIDELKDLFIEALSGAKEENYEAILTTLTSIDYSDFDSIYNALDAIEDLSSTIDYSLIRSIQNAANSFEKFDAKKIQEKIQTKIDAIDIVQGKIDDNDFIFSKDDYESIIKNRPELKDSFEEYGDDYVFLGDSIVALLQLIKNDTGTLTKKKENPSEPNQLSKVSNDIQAMGSKIEINKITRPQKTDTYTLPFEFYNETYPSATNLEDVYKTQKEEQQKLIAESIGIDPEEIIILGNKEGSLIDYRKVNYQVNAKEEKITDKTIKEILEEYSTAPSSYNKQDIIKILQSNFNSDITDTATKEEVKQAVDEILQSIKNLTIDNLTDAFKNMTPEEIANFDLDFGEQFTSKEIFEAQTKALRTQEKVVGATTEGYYYFYKNLTKVGLAEQEAQLKARALNIQLAEQKKNIADNADKLEDYIKAINNSTKGSIEFNQNAEKLVELLNYMFGVNLDKNFLFQGQNYLNLQKWIQGDEQAFNNLMLAIFNSSIQSEELIDKSKILLQTLNYLNGLNLEIGAVMDLTDFVNGLDAITEMTLQEKEIVESIFANMGYAVTFKQNEDEKGNKTFSFETATKISAYSDLTPTSFKENKDKKDPYKQSLDWLYDLNEDINEETRKREKLQLKLNRLLEDEKASGKDILDNLIAQRKQLERERGLEKIRLEAREKEMQKLMEQNPELAQYAWYDEKTKTIDIDWEKYRQITDSSLGERFDDFLGRLEEVQEQIDESQDRLDEIDDDVKELQEVGKDAYLDLEQRVLDALVAERQEEIDKLSDINDSINDSNQKLINTINSNLSKIRQDRENQETEKDIGDLQERLAYLRQDTSGMNQLEVLQLEEQLAEQRQSYTDALIDQKISELEEQNSKAEEQRQQQIDILQSQLNWDEENGELWKQVKEIIDTGLSEEGVLLTQSKLTTLLQSAEGWKAMSEQQKADWASELQKTAEQAWTWDNNEKLSLGNFDSDNILKSTKTTIDSRLGDLDTSIKSLKDDIKEIQINYNYDTSKAEDDEEKEDTSPTSPPAASTILNELKNKIDTKSKRGELERSLRFIRPDGGADEFTYNKKTYIYYDGKFFSKNDVMRDNKTGEWFIPKGTKYYKTGGLADFTGPAWLDGTKTKPEIVLNARDTQNFLQLKDILASLLHGEDLLDEDSSSGGDNYFDIDIQVDELKDDYDVEALVSKIKSMILADASYRNVNAINILR